MEHIASSTSRALAAVLAEGRRAVAEHIEALSSASDECFADSYVHLVAALEQAFRAEELVMEAVNSRALRGHLEQHARALGALHQVMPQIEAGDIALGREALELLGRFLLMQRSTMDLALSAALAPRIARPRPRKMARWARRRRPGRAPHAAP